MAGPRELESLPSTVSRYVLKSISYAAPSNENSVGLRIPYRFGASRALWIGCYDQVKMRYTVILEKEPDGGYVATVPALPGCVSQGDTREEALTSIREAADLYIEDCIASGDPVPTEADREYVELTTETL